MKSNVKNFTLQCKKSVSKTISQPTLKRVFEKNQDSKVLAFKSF